MPVLFQRRPVITGDGFEPVITGVFFRISEYISTIYRFIRGPDSIWDDTLFVRSVSNLILAEDL